MINELPKGRDLGSMLKNAEERKSKPVTLLMVNGDRLNQEGYLHFDFGAVGSIVWFKDGTYSAHLDTQMQFELTTSLGKKIEVTI